MLLKLHIIPIQYLSKSIGRLGSVYYQFLILTSVKVEQVVLRVIADDGILKYNDMSTVKYFDEKKFDETPFDKTRSWCMRVKAICYRSYTSVKVTQCHSLLVSRCLLGINLVLVEK